MKAIAKTAGIFVLLAVVFMSIGVCYAGYEFDDLMGNGYTSQWMAIDGNGATFGGKFNEAIQFQTDVLGNYDDTSVIKILNGHSDEEIEDRELHVLFLLAVNGIGRVYMDMKAEEMSFDISTPTPGFSTIGTTTYTNALLPVGQPASMDATWRRFNFTFQRSLTNTYDSVVQLMNFHQNPKNTPSQTIQRPLIISNVAPATAQFEPLILRMTLRDNKVKNSNIVAYDRVTWDMTGNITAGGKHWVFVPLEDDLLIDNETVNYFLTTEVINHTAVRYAAATYDAYGDYTRPDYWKFDLDRSQGTTYIDSTFQLAANAHIPPGLVSVFQRGYDINEQNKRPLILYPIDAPEVGNHELRLSHKIIYGKRLGATYKQPAPKGNFNLFEVTAFQPKVAGSTFYDNLQTITKAPGTIKVPTTSSFGTGSITRDETMPSTILQHFTLNQNIPGNLRNGTDEGMLPVHVTLNIPITLIDDRIWLNDMITKSRNGEYLENTFFEKYHLYLLTQTNGVNNIWNLSQELERKGQYNNQIKVFFDGDRGVSNTDNDRGVITVSFISMLLDGTRDGVRPELSIIEDHSITSDNDYIVIRDGINDNRWKMTFFIAPAGYKDNSNTTSADTSSRAGNTSATAKRLSSANSGGCSVMGNIFFSLLFLDFGFFVFAKREKR